MKTGMYGFSPERWEYIWKNVDFWEVFIPSKNGHAKTMLRKEFWESVGYKVIPYEDIGVSVGIYVMQERQRQRTYGDFSKDTEMQDKLGEYLRHKKTFP